MKSTFWQKGISRRNFLKRYAAGVFVSLLHSYAARVEAAGATGNNLFWITDIPDQPFLGRANSNYHAAVDSLLHFMGLKGSKFYRSPLDTILSGPEGMIEPKDVVLIKVNAQWKYRGCSNSDLIRGLIQRILDHPDGFSGEVVIIENGQGRGSLNCDTSPGYPDASVHANANDESQTFTYLVNTIFNNRRVSSYLLDRIGGTFIGNSDHVMDGYRRYEPETCVKTMN
ncbi:MAG: hypothetical protein ABSB32_15770 [Thermodesulfobacteriota bacterium]